MVMMKDGVRLVRVTSKVGFCIRLLSFLQGQFTPEDRSFFKSHDEVRKDTLPLSPDW